MDLSLQEILDKYWSQVLLLITGIGIIVKMIFNFILKKKEVTHGIFHKSKMEALVRFYNSYAEVKSMWNKLPIFRIYQNQISDTEVDNIIQTPLNKLEASVIELQVYFEPHLFSKFKEIENNMFEINGCFLRNRFQKGPKNSLIERTNNYAFFREDIEKLNTQILSRINTEIAKKF